MVVNFAIAAAPTKGEEALTHMQLDGEPWPQVIPHGKDAQPIKVCLPHWTAPILLSASCQRRT